MRRAGELLLLLAFIVLVVLDCMGIFPLDVVARLLFGWVLFIARTFRTVRVNREGVASALACLTGVLLIGHVLARWCWRETGHARPWRFAWTAACVAAVVVMFAAGIAVTGVGHQVVWLATSDAPIMRLDFAGRRAVDRVKCAANMKQIGQAIDIFKSKHDGNWPNVLGDLLLADDIDVGPEVFVCPAGPEERAPGQTSREWASQLHGHVSYVYYGRGLRGDVPADRPVLSEPLANHEGEGVNILFGDGRCDFVKPSQAREVLGVRQSAQPSR